MKYVDHEFFYKNFEKVIRLAIENGRIAIIDENESIKEVYDITGLDDEIVLSYIIFNEETLIYAYTKYSQRYKNYFKRLCNQYGFWGKKNLRVRFLTKHIIELCKQKDIKLSYEPFMSLYNE